MRHLYLTLQHRQIVSELLEADFDAIREPFRVLVYDECLDWLLDQGAGTRKLYGTSELDRTRSRLPFVPHLGALRINPKSQVEHRAFRNYRGYTLLTAAAVPSSPTGVRLLRRTDELASAHRLADTYSSDRGLEFDRRVSSEGTIDYLVSQDQSTWHVALSVEPRQRLTVRPLTEEARMLVSGVEIAARPYIHVYPHGGLTVLLGLAVTSDEDIETDRLIRLIRLLIGRRTDPAFSFSMRGVKPSSVHDFVKTLAGLTTSAIAPQATHVQFVHLDYSLSVGADSETLSDTELSGLLTLDDRYRILKREWVEARAGLYGKYGGDRVVASRTSLAVCTAPAQFPPSGRRRFFWRCHAIKEFATMQAWVLWHVSNRLAAIGTIEGPDEATAHRLMAIGEHLVEFPRGLPAHHRKWYYECQKLVGGQRSVNRFYEVLANLHRDAQHAAMMRRMDESQKAEITLTNSQVGTLNLGTIIGDVETHITAIEGPDADRAQDALRAIAQAALDNSSLSDEQRKELLEGVDLLAEEADKAPNHRRNAIIRTVLTSLGAAGALAEVWSTAGPTLLDFFGV